MFLVFPNFSWQRHQKLNRDASVCADLIIGYAKKQSIDPQGKQSLLVLIISPKTSLLKVVWYENNFLRKQEIESIEVNMVNQTRDGVLGQRFALGFISLGQWL